MVTQLQSEHPVYRYTAVYVFPVIILGTAVLAGIDKDKIYYRYPDTQILLRDTVVLWYVRYLRIPWSIY